MSCGVGHRCGSDPILQWPWYRLAAVALNRPLAWEPPQAAGVAIKRKKKKTNPQITLQLVLHIKGSIELTNCRYCSTVGYIYWKKSVYKWILAVQTHVTQGSTLRLTGISPIMSEAEYLFLSLRAICPSSSMVSGVHILLSHWHFLFSFFFFSCLFCHF